MCLFLFFLVVWGVGLGKKVSLPAEDIGLKRNGDLVAIKKGRSKRRLAIRILNCEGVFRGNGARIFQRWWIWVGRSVGRSTTSYERKDGFVKNRVQKKRDGCDQECLGGKRVFTSGLEFN